MICAVIISDLRSDPDGHEQIVVGHKHMTGCYLQLLVKMYVPLALHSNPSLLEFFSSALKAPQMGLKRHNAVSISL